MCFDVPKVVKSPVCDHGHDEESRNGRDVKIGILDDYIRTSERFRVIRVFFRVPESYGNTYWALLGFRGEREAGCPPPPMTHPNWTRGAAPLSFFLSPSFPFSYSNKGGGILLGLGSPSRTPHLARPLLGPASSSLAPLYTGAGGTP